MREVIQLTVSLKHSRPPIWRSILVGKETSFFELHHIIQIVMGWKNYHLFEFNLDGYRVGMMEENDFGYQGNELLDATKTLLIDILSLEKDSFHYNYDFGDCWLHEISLDRLIAKEEKDIYPKCINGQLNCPRKIVVELKDSMICKKFCWIKNIRNIKKQNIGLEKIMIQKILIWQRSISN